MLYRTDDVKFKLGAGKALVSKATHYKMFGDTEHTHKHRQLFRNFD